MTNIYHILYSKPAIDEFDMPIDLEVLAKLLVKSGKLRISAFDQINFVHFSIPEYSISQQFSERELKDKSLLPITKSIIKQKLSNYKKTNLDYRVEKEILRLKNILTKYQKVSYSLEMKLARLFVQSAHPAVILLLLYEGVEIFISYSYSIGEVMDIENWRHSGENSGMQSTAYDGYDIYVSAGGDPFGEAEENAVYGDGFPAISRFMVIAAQEIGHYSDIIRDRYNRPISRHSADLSGRRAKDNVRAGRINDIHNTNVILNNLKNIGIEKIIELEQNLKFYKKNKRFIFAFFTKLKLKLQLLFFKSKCRKLKYNFIFSITPSAYLGTQIIGMLKDMLFNLAPEADVYKRQNKQEEEAIACIEALARVPQQVVKWGHITTKATMRNLYKIYYQEVIPKCIETYEQITGKKYSINNLQKPHILRKFKHKLIKRLRALINSDRINNH